MERWPGPELVMTDERKVVFLLKAIRCSWQSNCHVSSRNGNPGRSMIYLVTQDESGLAPLCRGYLFGYSVVGSHAPMPRTELEQSLN
jgi:hypothetical protein